MRRTEDVARGVAVLTFILWAGGCEDLDTASPRSSASSGCLPGSACPRPGVNTRPAPPLEIGSAPAPASPAPAPSIRSAQPALPPAAAPDSVSSPPTPFNPVPPVPRTAGPAPQTPPVPSTSQPPPKVIDDGLGSQGGPVNPQPTLRETVPVPAAMPPQREVPTPTTPPAPLKPADARAKLWQLYKQAAEQYDGIDAFTARLRRREQVKGKDNPEELLLFRFRKQPFSVYMKWIGPVATGREVVYVQGAYENKIHTRLSKADSFLMAGKRISLAPDSPMVRDSGRHSITEAGFGSLITRFGRLLEAIDKGDTRFGTLTYLGSQTRPEFKQSLEGAEQVIPAGADPQLPGGGRRLVLFDPASHLPVLISTRDDKGHEVEYYVYEEIQYPVRFTDDDFNPDRLWSSSRR
jgi:hypothetical protein